MTHLLLIGPPGTGKTIYARDHQARRFHGKPAETARARSYIYRVAGLEIPRVDKAPFRAPHHTASTAALRGTVTDGYLWRPGEFSIAHGGTLFLDELPEFRHDTIDALREALRGGTITCHGLTVPTSFRFIGALNPCPCGYHGYETAYRVCRCSEARIKRYRDRVPAWLTAMCRVMGPDEYTSPKPAQVRP